MKKIAMTMNNHHELQDGDIDLGKLAENSNYHTTGATLHPRYKIICIDILTKKQLINNIMINLYQLIKINILTQ